MLFIYLSIDLEIEIHANILGTQHYGWSHLCSVADLWIVNMNKCTGPMRQVGPSIQLVLIQPPLQDHRLSMNHLQKAEGKM